jgi:hypothetical protein
VSLHLRDCVDGVAVDILARADMFINLILYVFPGSKWSLALSFTPSPERIAAAEGRYSSL